MTDTRTWIVTGAGRGLGRAITDAALAAGHTVIATVRGAHTLPTHPRLHTHRLDVRVRAGAAAVVEAALDATGRVDVVVNNAGFGLVGAVEEVSESEAREIIDTDLLGALWLSQAAVPAMRDAGAGHIVQISSVGAVGAMPLLGLYNAAKWGLEGFSGALAAEVAPFGIRVSIVQPGSMDTEWATASMRFAAPLDAYADLRASLFGTSEVPWPVVEHATGGGTAPEAIAEKILRHVADPADRRFRVLVGDDSPGQVGSALRARIEDYSRDPRFSMTSAGAASEPD